MADPPPDPSPDDPSPYDPAPRRGLTRTRATLLSVYAALDDRLRDELRYVGVDLPAGLDPDTQLEELAEAYRTDDGGPAVHPLQLAFAAMAVLGRAETPRTAPSLRAVAAELADPRINPQDNEPAVTSIAEALRAAAAAAVRWSPASASASRQRRWVEVN